MKSRFFSSVVGLGLMLAASSASAVPIMLDISTTSAQSSGAWTLLGPSVAGDGWFHFGTDSDVWNFDIDPGAYAFGLLGEGATLFSPGSVSWTLLVNGVTVLDGLATLDRFDFELLADGTIFKVNGVPEPSAIALLGAGLVALGLFRRRRV